MKPNNPKFVYISFADLKRDYALPQLTVYNLIKEYGFPKSKELSSQSVRFECEAEMGV